MAIAIKKSHEGRLHRALGVSEGKKLTADQIMQALHNPNPDVRRMANFARNARKFKH